MINLSLRSSNTEGLVGDAVVVVVGVVAEDVVVGYVVVDLVVVVVLVDVVVVVIITPIIAIAKTIPTKQNNFTSFEEQVQEHLCAHLFSSSSS